ncbi:MAG: carbohydrate-binding protein [Gammaproteobacteria bacterium]|nr:MAG: carbohydrate-binding protein [Gammaproteobacteria bacterium]
MQLRPLFTSLRHDAIYLQPYIALRSLCITLGLALPLVACGGGGGSASSPKSVSSAAANNSSVLAALSSSSISSAMSSNSSAASVIANQNVGFVLPFDDKSAGITQVGALLNHTPAGKFGPIKVDANGHFAAGTERERFLGVNITAGSTMPSHENAEKIAQRLAKFGVNLVRFHHMDNHFGANSIINYATGSSRTLNAVNVEKLDYFFNQLKLNGIYVDLNLINSREFFPADGLPAELTQLSWKQSHVLGFVNDNFRNLEKEYARNLLTHKNPYTKLTYAEDPAVAFVEINNENGFFQQYYDGSVDKWPSVFRAQLITKWNAWLATKYANTAALESAWGALDETLGAEKLLNNDFAAGLTSWSFEKHDVAVATTQVGTFDGRSGLKITVTTAGAAAWNVQLNQGAQTIVKDKLYTLGFWAKADSTRSLSVALALNYDPWTTMEARAYNIDGTWKYFETSFIASTSDTNTRINFNGFGNQLATVYLADVSLKSGGTIGKLPSGQTLEAKNINANLRSEGYTNGRSLDWADFLRSIESAYWLDMKNYIKTDLKFAGLVTGTAIMNSPPSAQKQMDFADAHAYWQHPQFPGADWDGVNWTVKNVSMVNTINSTISGLSKQRIKGMPFTISEYQHASPVAYSAEGPLFAAAYGALQDWDGIMFFAYDANGNDNWAAGYFSDFFSMNAHSAKMANMLIAANIFRRGDVAAAQNLVAMNWNPATELSVLANKGSGWNVANGSHLNVPDDLPLTKRFALDVSATPQGLNIAPAASASTTLTSDTNELVWNRSVAEKGVVTINTAKTKSIVGFINGRSFGLGNVTISVAPTTFDWATVSLTLQQGSFTQPAAGAKLLMVLTGNVENTNMGWTDATHTSVSNNWGKAPTLIEVIPATIDLPFAAANTSAWILDETGQRKAQLNVSDNNGKARIILNGATATLWYEVEVVASN